MLGALGVLLDLGGLPPVPAVAAGRPGVLLALEVSSGVALLVAAWLVRTSRPSASVGLALGSIGVLAPSWAWYARLAADPRAWSLGAPVLLIAAAAVTVTGWRPPRQCRLLAAAGVGFSMLAAVLHMVGYDPIRHLACEATCWPANAPLAAVFGPQNAYASVALSAAVAAACTVAAAVAAVRSPITLRVGSAIAAVVVATVPASIWLLWPDPVRPEWWTSAIPVAGLCLGIPALWLAVVSTVTLTRVRRLDERLDDPDAALAKAAGVRELQLLVPGTDVWVDATGTPVHPATGGLVLEDEVGPSVRLVLGSGRDAATAAAALTPPTLIALENLRLDAACRYREQQLRESQRRIVETRDAERYRIERDLHDGAQQPLVAALLHLHLAGMDRDEHGGAHGASGGTAFVVNAALESLRDLSHGLYPVALADAGLGAALEDLAAESSLTVALDLDPLPELARSTQLAAYDAVAAALSRMAMQPSARRASVTARWSEGWLRLIIDGDASSALPSADLTGVSDRVGAQGGTMTIDQRGMTVTLPCA